MLKVVHIIPSLGKGGAERIALDICNSLQKRPDVKVKLIVLSKINEYPVLTKDLDVHFINIEIGLSIWKKNKFHLQELQSILDEFAPDIIHTHLFIAELAGHAIMRKGVKYISHFHDNVEQLKKISSIRVTKRTLTNSYERKWIMQQYLEGDCGFITISKNSYDYFQKNLDARLKDRVVYLPNAVDASRFLYQSRQQMNDPINIINCGSFIPRKNQSFLVDCLYEIRKNGINARIIFLGDGIELENVKRKSDQKGLSEFISFAGNVNDPENYYKTADIYFHGASFETFGLVLIEAMLSGLPVISLDGIGNRDIIRDGENGFVIETETPQLFYEKLKYLLNKNEYNRMSKTALEFGLRFDIVDYTNTLMKIYTK